MFPNKLRHPFLSLSLRPWYWGIAYLFTFNQRSYLNVPTVYHQENSIKNQLSQGQRTQCSSAAAKPNDDSIEDCYCFHQEPITNSSS